MTYRTIAYPDKIVSHKYIECVSFETALRKIIKYDEISDYYTIHKAYLYIKNTFIKYITKEIVQNAHRIIFTDSPNKFESKFDDYYGRFRPHNIDMYCLGFGYVYNAPPAKVAKEEFSILENNPINTIEDIKEWYEKFERLHLFIEGNGRTGRIIFFAISNILTNKFIVPKDYDGWDNIGTASIKTMIVKSKYT